MKKTSLTILTACLLFLTTHLRADAAVWSKLPSPVWTQTTSNEWLHIQDDVHVRPDNKTVYLHVQEERVVTKVFVHDTLKAIDAKTGKVKWSFPFVKPGIGYLSTDDPFLYASNGTVYAHFAYHNVLYSINGNGKVNWMKKLPGREGTVHLMKDNLLVHVVPQSTKTGSESTIIYGYNNMGKQLFKKVIKGVVMKVTDRYIISQTHSEYYRNFKADVYDTSMEHLFRYSFPKEAFTLLDMTVTLTDGTIIFRANLEETGNRLLAVTPKGKTLWGRSIPGNSWVTAAGSNYAVYEDHTLALYSLNGLVAKRTFKAPASYEEFVTYSETHLTQDGKLLLNLGYGQYILNPETLEPLHTFKLGDDRIVSYSGDGVLALSNNSTLLGKCMLK